MIDTQWDIFKSFIDSVNGSSYICYVEYPDRYHVWVEWRGVHLVCKNLYKDSNSCSEFETGYKAKANKPDMPVGKDGFISRVAAFHDSDFHRFRGKGFKGVAYAGQTTDIVFKVPSNFSMNGCQIILKNHTCEDSLTFYVMDIDNILGYGSNTILDTFCDQWNIDSQVQSQFPVILPYKANLIAGLYLVARYSSSGQSDVYVGCNLFRHIKES